MSILPEPSNINKLQTIGGFSIDFSRLDGENAARFISNTVKSDATFILRPATGKI
jgi:hypothetical protein